MKKQTKKITTKGWPLKKFFNKFWIFNLLAIIGLIMLILSICCRHVFDDNNKVISNIVASSIILAAGLIGDVTYGLLLHFKGEKPLEKKWANLCTYCSWVPLLGFIFSIIWKTKENNALYAKKKARDPKFKKPRMQLPNSISIIFAALVGIVFVIWILYIAGVLKPTETQTIPGVLDIFLNPIRGFAGYTTKEVIGYSLDGKPIYRVVSGVASIVIFLLIFNGTMSLVNDSKAIEAGVGGLLRKMHGKEIVLIPILMLFLAICGSTFNMCEQLLPLFLIIIPIFFAAGFDRMTGFLVVFMSAGVGVLGSTVNPVLIGTAVNAMQDQQLLIALMDGIVWRLVIFAVVTIASIICTMVYANRVKKNPTKSLVYMSKADFAKEYSFDQDALPPMTKKRAWTLIVFAIAFLMLIVGFVDWKQITGFTGFEWLSTNFAKAFPFLSSIAPIGSWGMVEAGMLFFIAALIIGAINWQGASHWFATFYKGCREFIGVAFIVAVAKGLAITLTDSGFNDMIANGLGSVLGKSGTIGAILLVFLVTCLLTLFITSSSGLSSALMPVIGPAVDTAFPATAYPFMLSGTVTSFAAGMGFVNLFTPTGMVLPFLEVSKMDMGDFVKTAWKQILIIFGLTIGLLAVGPLLPGMIF